MAKQARKDTRVVYAPSGTKRLILTSKDSGWLTAAEVAQTLQVSDRQVQRYQTSRELKTFAYLKVLGRKPLTLYKLDEVMKIKKTLEAERKISEFAENRSAMVLNATTVQRRTDTQARQASQVQEAIAKIQFFNKGFGELLEDRELFQAVTLELLARSSRTSLKDKVLLTIKEAHELGFRESSLGEMVRTGHLKNFGSKTHYLVSRHDLDALAGAHNNGNGGRVKGALSFEEQAKLKRA